MSSCTLVLDQTKLPKIISKLEFFMFRAVEKRGTSFFSLLGKERRENIKELLKDVKEQVIPEYINSYAEKAKQYKDAGYEEEYAMYQGYITKLSEVLALWDKIVPNFVYYSSVFSVKNKFTVDEQGLVDLSEIADDEERMYGMMDFDQNASEIDPLDEVDKIVELYLRSMIDENQSDSFTDVVAVNYPKLVQQLFSDLRGAYGLQEIVNRLRSGQQENPIYKTIADRLEDVRYQQELDTSFKIRFQNTFSKAYVPLYMVSVENKEGKGNTIKVLEASSGKRSFYESMISSNFFMRGMEVGTDFDANGVPTKKINLAEYIDGTWTLTASSINAIRQYIEKSPKSELRLRQLEILKGIGYSFSDKSAKLLLRSSYLGEKTNRFKYIYEHLLNVIEYRGTSTNPYKDLNRVNIPVDNKRKVPATKSQAGTLDDFIQVEMKYNSQFNVEHSQINPEGKRQYSIQLHNNLTLVSKFLNDSTKYPTLQSILENEPNAFWLDPQKNVSIRGSYIMNSIFHFDPQDPNYGKRRLVASEGSIHSYNDTNGKQVQLSIVNTGGVQYKKEIETEVTIIDEDTNEPLIDRDSNEVVTKTEKSFDSNAKKTVKLSNHEKLLQDINSFLKRGYNSILRLSDKSTDLGFSLNFYYDPVTKQPVVRPLDALRNTDEAIYNSSQFRMFVHDALKDIMAVKFLNRFGYMSDLNAAKKNMKTYAALDGVLSDTTKSVLDDVITKAQFVEDISLEGLEDMINEDINNYFKKYTDSVIKELNSVRNLVAKTSDLIEGVNGGNFDIVVRFYLANSFIMDLEQMRLFFGDTLFFKDFHKRSSKDSATGTFTNLDPSLRDQLNDPLGYGKNNNLQSRMLLQQLRREGAITSEEYMSRMSDVSDVNRSYKSAVLKDVKFDSTQPPVINQNVEKLYKAGYISKGMMDLYNRSLKGVINDKYKGGTEADGQGKVTFDFYRTISILTNQWSEEQEKVYNKIVMYDSYDRAIDATTDESERARLVGLRDSVGYDPTEAVYFPPKKFQYSGPMDYRKVIDGKEYVGYIPVFDKFSLQPLIPTMTKNTPDDHLMKRMLYNNVGYVKYESGTKVERPTALDNLYEDSYDPAKPNERTAIPFTPGLKFNSEQTLFLDNLKEQVAIDSEIHDNAVFGSQIRKLIMMNIEHPEMRRLLGEYNTLIEDTVNLEKNLLYSKMGIEKGEGNRLKVKDLEKLIGYFFNEIERKNQSNNVRKALKYNEETKEFEIPLDGAIQAQVIEGIIISAINNNLVRYKTNGSMLVQVALTGNERIQLSTQDSETALKTFGSDDLKYYDLDESVPGKPRVKAMEVKIALTGQWLKLLELVHPDGFKIDSMQRLNDALKNETWRRSYENELRMVAYRIPTQGMNFMDVMTVKEFLPASFGDAIIMPSEVVIKSGSDFDIDKMFVFYPNLDRKGKFIKFDYAKEFLNSDLETEKKKAVTDLKHWKNYRNMTLMKIEDEYNQIKRDLNKEKRNDTKTRDRLNTLIRQVNIILMMMDGEDRKIRNEFNRLAVRNEKEDSYLNQMISDNIIFNVDEYEEYKKEKSINVLNPLFWIDTKREGLSTLLESLNNLQNKTVDQLENQEAFQRELMTEIKDEVASELNRVYERLYRMSNIKGNLQNKLYDIMANSILHPSNYIQLVTPSDNFMIMPVVDKIYQKIGKGVDQKGEHLKTDYSHTEILNRLRNAEKFQSLLRGKSDLGIAAVANTLNVLLQITGAQGNSRFFTENNIKTFFNVNSNSITKSAARVIESVNYADIYDEDGNLKSEFYSEFINAFVDAAKDDYVFTVNVVTELSPIMFYMKYMGIGTEKIMYFINQPVMRKYVRYLMDNDNMFVKAADPNVNSNVRNEVIGKLIGELGGLNSLADKYINKRKKLNAHFEFGQDAVSQFFTSEGLYNGMKTDSQPLSSLSSQEKQEQLAVLLEFLNMKEQSNSFTSLQKAINFDTKPYKSSYDVYERNEEFGRALKGAHVLSPESVINIRDKTMISPLNVQNDLTSLLRTVLPVRNNHILNSEISSKIETLASNFQNKSIVSSDDKLKFARTAKNDFLNYILQRFFDKSEKGMAYFKEYFGTTKSLNDYLSDLVTTKKLAQALLDIRNLEDYDSSDPEIKPTTLLARFPIIGNIVLEPGEFNKRITTVRIVKNSNNVIDENDFQEQFDMLVNLPIPEDPKDAKDFLLIRNFFRDLALYSIFQSGLNTSDVSYTSLTPKEATNKLYGFAIDAFRQDVGTTSERLRGHVKDFLKRFQLNNPDLYGNSYKVSNIMDVSKRGKWYGETKLSFKNKIAKSRVAVFEGTKNTKEKARTGGGIYSMRPNPGDGIPGVNEKLHFGNPWSHKGGQQYFESLLPVEGSTDSEKIENAVKNYEAWLQGTKFQDVEPERRQWIIGLVESGRLFGKTFLYFKPGYKSHANVLVDFINKKAESFTGELPTPSKKPVQQEVKKEPMPVKNDTQVSTAEPVVATTESKALTWMNDNATIMDEFKKKNEDFQGATNQEIAEMAEAMYEQSKIAGESIEEFLQRLFCQN